MKKSIFLTIVLLVVSASALGQTAAQLKRAGELFSQASVFYNKGQYDLAIANYTEYIKIRPNIPEAWYYRGLSYYLKGTGYSSGDTKIIKENIDRAVSDFTEAIRLAPKSPDNFTYRGLAYAVIFLLDVEKYSALAISDFTQAIKLQPSSSEIYRHRADMYDSTFRTELAIADYTRAIQLNDRNVAAYVGRGAIYRYEKRYQLGKADLEAALRLDPGNKIAKNHLESINRESGNRTQPAGVLETWKNFAEKGKVYLEQKDPDNAIASFQKAISMLPVQTRKDLAAVLVMRDKALLRENIAKAYFAKNDFQKTVDFYALAHTELMSVLVEAFKNDSGKSLELDIQTTTTESYIGPAIVLAEIGKRGMDVFEIKSLTTDQKQQLLKLAAAKLTSADIASKILHLNSMIRLKLSNSCKTERFPECGEKSSNNLIAAHAKKSLDDINKAIEFSPFMKMLYIQRSEVYRFLGKNDLARVDLAKANQLKDN